MSAISNPDNYGQCDHFLYQSQIVADIMTTNAERTFRNLRDRSLAGNLLQSLKAMQIFSDFASREHLLPTTNEALN